jgi:hypothetical protein
VTTSEAAGTGYPRLGFVHRETTPLVFVVIESLDRSVSLGVGVHLDETEPLAAPHITVLDDLGALHGAERCEPPSEIGRSGRIRQVSNMQSLSHEILLEAEFFDPWIAFWVDEKGAHNPALEVGKARGGSRK